LKAQFEYSSIVGLWFIRVMIPDIGGLIFAYLSISMRWPCGVVGYSQKQEIPTGSGLGFSYL
jgi:hypothetical protein